jgi:hypothetical protein
MIRVRYAAILLVLFALPAVADVPEVPLGQMRGMLHWHTWRSDGVFSAWTSAEYAKTYGAEFIFGSDHAHKLADTKTMLDSFAKIPEQYQVEMGKMPIEAPAYLDEWTATSSVLPAAGWFEVGEESHFLVCPGYGMLAKENAGEIVRLGRQTKALGTQEVIKRIDKILQATGGFMIAAHPVNPQYPFNYNFNGCRSAVGCGFFNGLRSEHWKNFDFMLRLQRESARPVIAVAEVDLHLTDDFLTGATAAVFGQKAVDSFRIGLDDVKSYRQSRRFTYIYGRSTNSTLIACQIRDGRSYAAYGDVTLPRMTAEPGTSYFPPPGNDRFEIQSRGLPQEVSNLRAAFVDDETGEISECEAPWTNNQDGSRSAVFSVNKLRKLEDHSGKLILATTEFVTSAITVLGNPQAIAKRIQEEKIVPVIESPAVPKSPAVLKPSTSPAIQPTGDWWRSYRYVLRGPRKFGNDREWDDYFTPFIKSVVIGYNPDGRAHVQIQFGEKNGGKQPLDLDLQLRRDGEYDYVGETTVPSMTFLAGNRCLTTASTKLEAKFKASELVGGGCSTGYLRMTHITETSWDGSFVTAEEQYCWLFVSDILPPR